jgi:HK97 family phage prohead protease
MEFADIVKRTEADERDYIARFSGKGTDGFRELPSLFVKSIDEANRQIEAVVSTGDIDRDEEIILPEAFKETLSIYLTNGVVISSHQHRLETGHSSVIGRTVKAWIDAKGLHVIIEFAETDLGNEFWYLYKNKYQRAFSIGFIPLEWRDERDEQRGVIRTYTKVELLEISCVAVPSNRAALSRSKQRKADFVAAKIAQRKNLLADYMPKTDEEIIEDLKAKGEWPTEEGCFEFADMISQATEDDGLLDEDKSIESEPDYCRIVNKETTSEFYNE